MNKFYIFSIIFGALFMAGSALATVGGPTYISEIAISIADNAVYYKVHDGGGRGCPPIIHKIDLATLKDSEVKSCNQVENEYSYNDMQKYEQFIADIYQDLFYLGSVSLTKNNIDVKVEFLKENKLEGEDNWVISSDFRATITQDSKKIGEIKIPILSESGIMYPSKDRKSVV